MFSDAATATAIKNENLPGCADLTGSVAGIVITNILKKSSLGAFMCFGKLEANNACSFTKPNLHDVFASHDNSPVSVQNYPH